MNISPSPSKTTNPIHFEDLDPKRFEDLCALLVNRSISKWKEFRHYGKAGQDNGIDILGIEILDDQSERTWIVQCKRTQRITQSEIKEIIDKVKDTHHDVLLIVVSCSFSKKLHDYYLKYAKGAGIKEPLYWDKAHLETLLYNRAPDVLATYFGISPYAETLKKESNIVRNIRLKQKMKRDLLKNQGLGYPADEHEQILKFPWLKFKDNDLIVHSIDDTDYPQDDSFQYGVSSWFKTIAYGFYYNGMEIMSMAQSRFDGYIREDGAWTLSKPLQDIEKFTKVTLLQTRRIPFKNIVDYDLEGDEYYNCPHIYCRYSEGGSPYECEVYRLFDRDKGVQEIMNPALQII